MNIKQKTLIGLIFCVLSAALCAKSDDDYPLQIESDNLSVNYKDQTGVYSGNVVADQGSRHLTADHVFLVRDASLGQLSEVHAFGKPGKQAYLELKPKSGDGLVKAKSDEMIHYPLRKKLIFKGNVEVNQSGKIYYGPFVTYDLKTEVVESPASQHGGRVRMILPASSDVKS